MSFLSISAPTTYRTTNVPNVFIDKYMTNANGDFVKTYIYILSCYSRNKMCSVNSVADALMLTENDVIRALKYWDSCGIMDVTYSFDKSTVTAIQLKDFESEPSVPKNKSTVQPDSNFDNSEDSSFDFNSYKSTRDFALGKAMEDSDDLKEIFFMAEKYLGKTLSPQENKLLFDMYEKLEFSYDMIECILLYALEKDKGLRYVSKIAYDMHDLGVTNSRDIKDHLDNFCTVTKSVRTSFGITGRNLGKDEQEYVNKWIEMYGTTPEIITEACDRTISSIHDPSFKYANSIIEKWHEANVKSLDDVKREDEKFEKTKEKSKPFSKTSSSSVKSSFHNFSQKNDYDMDKIEDMILNDTINQKP